MIKLINLPQHMSECRCQDCLVTRKFNSLIDVLNQQEEKPDQTWLKELVKDVPIKEHKPNYEKQEARKKLVIHKRNGMVDVELEDGKYQLNGEVTIENGILKYIDNGIWSKISNIPDQQGECKCICHCKGKDCSFCVHNPECSHCDPPEHEEDFDRLAQGLRNHVIDDVRFSGLFEYVKDYIRDNFVSKSKIKREIDKLQKSCYEADGVIDGITALHHLREKLGLGD